jgi:4-hydroxybenzoate polyprenyltransferase
MILGLWQLVRPVNVLITGIAVLLGFSLGGGEADWLLLLCGPLSAMLVAAFANVDNDIADLQIDRRNRPRRPLPAGRITLRAAFIWSLLLLLLGLLAARGCGKEALAMAGGVAVWLVVYNRWAKRQLLIGNIMVALAGGMPLVYAGIVSPPAPGRWAYLWLAFALAAAFHLARELLKDIQDVEGDRLAGANTVPIKLGLTAALRLTGTYLLLIALLSLIPAYLQWLNKIYLYGIIALVVTPSAVAAFQLRRHPTSTEAGKWARVTKGMMIAGIILLWLGA